VIPAYNEEKYVSSTIKSLLNQDYENLEIIFVDDHSEDRTFEVVKKRFGGKIKIYRTDRKYNPSTVMNSKPSYARRYGILKSKGDFILHFSAHLIAPPNLISTLVRELPDDAVCIGCRDVLYPGTSVIGKIIYLFWSLGRNRLFPKQDGYVRNIVYGIYRKKVLEELNGFPFGGDCELNIILNRKRYKKYYTTKTYVYYWWHPKSNNSLTSFVKRMIIYGNARGFFTKKYNLPSQKYFLLSLLTLPFGYGVGFILAYLGVDVRRSLGW